MSTDSIPISLVALNGRPIATLKRLVQARGSYLRMARASSPRFDRSLGPLSNPYEDPYASNDSHVSYFEFPVVDFYSADPLLRSHRDDGGTYAARDTCKGRAVRGAFQVINLGQRDGWATTRFRCTNQYRALDVGSAGNLNAFAEGLTGHQIVFQDFPEYLYPVQQGGSVPVRHIDVDREMMQHGLAERPIEKRLWDHSLAWAAEATPEDAAAIRAEREHIPQGEMTRTKGVRLLDLSI